MLQRLSCAALICLFAAGCGKGAPTDEITEIGRIELGDIWDMYQAVAKQSGKTPAAASDLKTQALGSPLGGRALNDPNYVIHYGTPVGGTTVLAYHKDTATKGGLVLLADGTIKAVTAEQFAALPKPAGK